MEGYWTFAARHPPVSVPAVVGSSWRPFPVRYDVDGRLADSLLAQRPQRPAPRDHLIQHVVNRLLMMLRWLEDAEVLEVGEERERDLRAHVGDHQLAHDESQVFDGPGAARAAVAHETRGLVGPLLVEVVDHVL